MIAGLFSSLGIWVLLPGAFWMLMIFDCVRNEPDRQTWLWILMFLNVPGALIYCVACWLPRANVPIPNYFKRWASRQPLWNAEAAVKNIGKAHQYVTLGNVLCDLGTFDKAVEAYDQALEKEPENTHALWGMAFLEMKNQQFDRAKNHLKTLLKLDRDYKCGEASLLYGKALSALKDWDAAKIHLEQDIKYWSHPESSTLLAQILIDRGNTQEARDCLTTMTTKVKASPIYHYRRNKKWVSRAEKMLRSL